MHYTVHSLSACFCVIEKLGFKNKNAHNINTHKTFTLCGSNSGFGLTVLVTTIEASMSLFQQLNICHLERDVVRTSTLQLARQMERTTMQH